MPHGTRAFQLLASVPLATLTALQWLTWLALANNIAARWHPLPWLVTVNWWLLAAAFLVFITPPGRMGVAAACARILLSGLQPGTYPRGGSQHMRCGWPNGSPRPAARRTRLARRGSSTTPAHWVTRSARVDLHSAPPVTGMLTLGHRSSVEPEVDLCGHWIDGDLFHVGPITIENDATVGGRSTLAPAPSSARTPTWRPVRRSWTRSSAGSTGRAHRR